MKIHIVQKGDTLWKIAQKYDVDFEQLKQMNAHLSNPDMIMPGMKIKVPTQSVPVKKKEVQKKEAVNPYLDKSPKAKPVMDTDLPKKVNELPKKTAESKPMSFNLSQELNNFKMNVPQYPVMPQYMPSPGKLPGAIDEDESPEIEIPEPQEPNVVAGVSQEIPKAPVMPQQPVMPMPQMPAVPYPYPQNCVPMTGIIPGSGLGPGYPPYPAYPVGGHGIHPQAAPYTGGYPQPTGQIGDYPNSPGVDYDEFPEGLNAMEMGGFDESPEGYVPNMPGMPGGYGSPGQFPMMPQGAGVGYPSPTPTGYNPYGVGGYGAQAGGFHGYPQAGVPTGLGGNPYSPYGYGMDYDCGCGAPTPYQGPGGYHQPVSPTPYQGPGGYHQPVSPTPYAGPGFNQAIPYPGPGFYNQQPIPQAGYPGVGFNQQVPQNMPYGPYNTPPFPPYGGPVEPEARAFEDYDEESD